MGLTEKESAWMTSCLLQHNLFCSCEDPIKHMAQCLIMQAEEDATMAAASAIIDLGDGTGDNSTGDGDLDAADALAALG
ncbi:ORF2 [torque teno Delphinidae virus 3]